MRTMVPWQIVLWGLLAATPAFPNRALGFRSLDTGDVVENPTLKTLSGTEQPVMKPGVKANLFIFVRPQQEASESALKDVAAICRAYAESVVHCVAIVSDAAAAREVAALLKNTGWKESAALIDVGDEYYGKLGVSLHPVVGVADSNMVLVAYEPFRKVGFAYAVELRIHRLVDDTGAGEEQAPNLLDVRDSPTKKSVAPVLNYARRLLEAGELEKAQQQAERAVELDAHSADAAALLGLILGKLGQCPLAIPSLKRALELDPHNATAELGKKVCTW